MKKILTLVIFSTIILSTLKSQEKENIHLSKSQEKVFFFGEKAYPRNNYNISVGAGCPSPNYYSTSKPPSLFFAKDENKNMIVFKIFVDDLALNTEKHGLKGNILLYLDNNETIKLIDRNIRSLVNNTQYSVYYLTDNEIKTLKKTNIKIIKYNRYKGFNLHAKTIKNKDLECELDSVKGYTKNHWAIKDEYTKVFERVDFPKIISNFFK